MNNNKYIVFYNVQYVCSKATDWTRLASRALPLTGAGAGVVCGKQIVLKCRGQQWYVDWGWQWARSSPCSVCVCVCVCVCKNGVVESGGWG